MTTKDKTRMWVGIGLILFVTIFVILFVIIPIIVSKSEPCNMFSSYHGIKLCSFSGLFIIGLVGSFFVGIPLVIAGISLILYSILKWQKIKNPGLVTFYTILLIILLAIAVFVLFLIGINKGLTS